MRCFWCILLAFFILSCGGNSTGPEPETQYKELSYENLAGFLCWDSVSQVIRSILRADARCNLRWFVDTLLALDYIVNNRDRACVEDLSSKELYRRDYI